jgi:Transposase DDE domain
MFIKKTKNGAGQTYLHLVEAYRDAGRTKQRVLLSLGRAENNRIENLLGAISKYHEVVTAADLAKKVSIDQTYIYGPFVILREIFDRFGVERVLQEIQKVHPRLEVDLSKLVFTLVASRFIAPLSKLGLFDGLLGEFYPEMVYSELKLHQIYRGLDILSSEKDGIENLLFWDSRDLLNSEVDVVLYDLTTLRFESTREDLGALRKFGFSKEMRSDCTQVVLGLLLDTEGIPLGFEVFPGNTFEGQTIKSIMEKMRTKFKIRRFIFVGDRGIFSKENLNELRGDKGEFIIGMKLGVFKKRADEFYDLNRFVSVSEEFKFYETKHEGDRCIITWSKKRAERDRKVREDILKKIEKKLKSKKTTPKAFVSNQNYHRFLTGLNSGEAPALNQKAIEEASRKDGFFAVVTNVVDMNGEEIISSYKQLWKIEDAFGEIKGTLKARPIFHWTDKRIVGHLVICFLAHYCEAQITRLLRQKNKRLKSKSIEDGTIKERPLTVVQAMRELAHVRVAPVKLSEEKTLWVRTDIKDNAATLFQTIGVKIPPKVLNLQEKNLVL